MLALLLVPSKSVLIKKTAISAELLLLHLQFVFYLEIQILRFIVTTRKAKHYKNCIQLGLELNRRLLNFRTK